MERRIIEVFKRASKRVVGYGKREISTIENSALIYNLTIELTVYGPNLRPSIGMCVTFCREFCRFAVKKGFGSRSLSVATYRSHRWFSLWARRCRMQAFIKQALPVHPDFAEAGAPL